MKRRYLLLTTTTLVFMVCGVFIARAQTLQEFLTALGNLELGVYVEDSMGVEGDVYLGGNLGVGTTTPDEKVTVDGYIKTTQGIKFPDGTVQMTAPQAFTGAITPWTETGGQVSYMDGNVAIGIANADERLTVSGKIKASEGIKFADGSLQTKAAPDFWLKNGNNLSYGSGSIGIGTTTPSEKLEVNGFIKTAQGIKFADGTVQSTATVGGGEGSSDIMSFVLGENLTAGTPIVLTDNNGVKAKKYKPISNSTVFNDSTTTSIQTAYDFNNDIYLLAYITNNACLNLKGVKITNGLIQYGSQTNLGCSKKFNSEGGKMLEYSGYFQKFIVAYSDGGYPSDGYIRSATVNPTDLSITLGTQFTFDTGQVESIAINASDSKQNLMVSFYDQEARYVKMFSLTLNNNSYQKSSNVNVRSTYPAGNLAFEANRQGEQSIITFQESSNLIIYSIKNNGGLTPPTLYSPTIINTAYAPCLVSLSENNFGFSYNQNNETKFAIVKYTTNAPLISDKISYDTTAAYTKMKYDKNNNKIALAYRNSEDKGKMLIINKYNAIEEEIIFLNTDIYDIAIEGNNGNYILSFRDQNNGMQGTSKLISPFVKDKVVGILQVAGNSGEIRDVVLLGGISGATQGVHSNLKIGEVYYLDVAGNLTTEKTDKRIGVALSSTKLLTVAQ